MKNRPKSKTLMEVFAAEAMKKESMSELQDRIEAERVAMRKTDDTHTCCFVCPRCGNSINPDVCWCGEMIKGDAHDNHHPIPVGCTCGIPTPDKPEKKP